jgi:hypothetical protein
MTPLGKFFVATLGIAMIIAATLALRPQPAPAVQHTALTPAQLADLQQPKAEQPKPEPVRVKVAPPDPFDDEDGNGS